MWLGGGEGVSVSRRGYGPVWMGEVMEVGMDMEGVVERGRRRGQAYVGGSEDVGMGSCSWARAWAREWACVDGRGRGSLNDSAGSKV